MLSQKMENITVVMLVRMDSPIVQAAPMMDAGVTPNSITLRGTFSKSLGELAES